MAQKNCPFNSEVSSFQRLKKWYIPNWGGKRVPFREVSSVQGCPYSRVPLYTLCMHRSYECRRCIECVECNLQGQDQGHRELEIAVPALSSVSVAPSPHSHGHRGN